MQYLKLFDLGAGAVSNHTNPLTVEPASHTNADSSPGCTTSDPAPC